MTPTRHVAHASLCLALLISACGSASDAFGSTCEPPNLNVKVREHDFVVAMQVALDQQRIRYRLSADGEFCYANSDSTAVRDAMLRVLREDTPVGRSLGMSSGPLMDLVASDLRAANVAFTVKKRDDMLWYVVSERDVGIAKQILAKYGLEFLRENASTPRS